MTWLAKHFLCVRSTVFLTKHSGHLKTKSKILSENCGHICVGTPSDSRDLTNKTKSSANYRKYSKLQSPVVLTHVLLPVDLPRVAG